MTKWKRTFVSLRGGDNWRPRLWRQLLLRQSKEKGAMWDREPLSSSSATSRPSKGNQASHPCERTTPPLRGLWEWFYKWHNWNEQHVFSHLRRSRCTVGHFAYRIGESIVRLLLETNEYRYMLRKKLNVAFVQQSYQNLCSLSVCLAGWLWTNGATGKLNWSELDRMPLTEWSLTRSCWVKPVRMWKHKIFVLERRSQYRYLQ